jgi:ActR/RegA family two-component response regulator
MAKPAQNKGLKAPKMALVVHPDVGVLSNLQSALSQNGFTPILARDLPTALLAMTHHYFHLAIVASQLREAGDGWPLAGVLHLVFPGAFVSVLAPSEDVLTLQAAINYGVREIYNESTPAAEVVSAILAAGDQTLEKRKTQVQ